uniref:Uncharacterized protein n=1 Tax=Anguilla anguilla TaxID=7936 RepID=A0A0E9V2D1_ANGAN
MPTAQVSLLNLSCH